MPNDPKPISEPAKQREIISSTKIRGPADPHPADEGAPYNNQLEDRPTVRAKSTFTAKEIAQIKKLLEEAANEPSESSEVEAVIGTLSDKIDSLRSSGMNNDEIGALLTQVTGATITGDQLAQFYAAPQDR